MFREIARGITRTPLTNGYWVNTVQVPGTPEGGRYHTVVYPAPGLHAAVAERRQETVGAALIDHAELVAAYSTLPSAEKRQRGQRRAQFAAD